MEGRAGSMAMSGVQRQAAVLAGPPVAEAAVVCCTVLRLWLWQSACGGFVLRLRLCVPVSVSVSLSVSGPLCLSVCLSVRPSVRLSVCPPTVGGGWSITVRSTLHVFLRRACFSLCRCSLPLGLRLVVARAEGPRWKMKTQLCFFVCLGKSRAVAQQCTRPTNSTQQPHFNATGDSGKRWFVLEKMKTQLAAQF